jgi:hypothetical protein
VAGTVVTTAVPVPIGVYPDRSQDERGGTAVLLMN